MNTLFSELRRRHVFKVAAAYGVVAWLLIQVAATTFPAFGAPPWVLRIVISLAVLGFPVALILAWAYEMTPDGVRRATAPAGADRSGQRGPWFDNRTAAWVGVGIVVGLATVGALGWDRTPGDAMAVASPGAEVRSLAVLPFASVGGEESDYFSDGITEELLNALAQLPQLQVAARTSSFSFKGQNVAVDSIARALRVDHVLEGSVRSAGGRVRIQAQLVDAATGRQIWTQRYDRELEDVLAVQEEIAVAIANALQVQLAGGDATRLVRSRTADPEAYELYLRGRHQLRQRDLTAAIETFEAAVARDPAFAAAYSGLADAYALSEDDGLLPREEAFPRASAAAQRALELDELQAEAHASMGHIYYHQENWPAAEREFTRALELNPSYAVAHNWYGNLLAATGRKPEALEAYEQAVALDPLSLAARTNRGMALFYLRRYEEAVAHLREMERTGLTHELVRNWLLWSLIGAERYPEAIGMATRLVAEAPSDDEQDRLWLQSVLTLAHASAGNREDADRLVRQLEAMLTPDVERTSVPYYLAIANYQLGRKDRAFALLHRAVEHASWMRAELPTHPGFDSLREDPRFAEVLERARQLSSAAGGPS